MSKSKEIKIAIIGLGYVGLPLAIEFGKSYKTFGFDINKSRINELLVGVDRTLEVGSKELKLSKKLKYTAKTEDIKDCNVYIITVPTPVDKFNKPDLSSLLKASEIVGRMLGKEDIVIYESTVYPGATEEECVPVLENYSKLIFNRELL